MDAYERDMDSWFVFTRCSPSRKAGKSSWKIYTVTWKSMRFPGKYIQCFQCSVLNILVSVPFDSMAFHDATPHWLPLSELTIYVGPDRFVVHNLFLSVFWWIYCYSKYGQEHTFSPRRFNHFRPKVAETSRQKRVLLSILVVTIYPSKDTEKCIRMTKWSSPT